MEEKLCHDIGSSLELLKDVILDHWEGLVKESITKAADQDTIILKDHMPEIIDQLIYILKEKSMEELELGKSHGFHRLILTNFSIQDILKEFSLFRETIIDYLYPMGAIDCSKLVHKYIDIVQKNSIAEFLNDLPIASRVEKNYYGSELQELKSNPVITGEAHPG